MTRQSIRHAILFCGAWAVILAGCIAFWLAVIGVICAILSSDARGDSMAVLRWDVELSRPAPYKVPLYRGETCYIEPRYLSYSSPVDIHDVQVVVMRYRDASVPDGYYYSVTGSVLSASEGRIRIPWTPACEAAASDYTYSIVSTTVTGATLRAFGTIKLNGVVSGIVTNQPNVTTTFDWAAVEHINVTAAPFLTDLELNALRQEFEDAQADQAITNAALAAAIAALEGGATNLTARRVTYDSALYTNVQDALDALLYVSPSVVLSGGGSYDTGRVITNVSLTWTCNKAMTSRELSGGATVSLGAGGSGSYTVTNAMDSSQTTYTLTVGDGTSSAASSTVNYFRDRRYWGWSATATALSSAQIRALSSELATTRQTTKTGLTPTGNQYLWICYPASWGSASQIILGGYPTTFASETATFTNAYGYASSYLRYRSPNLIGYTTSIEVQ